ncbi:MAG: leucine-rich repeat domain-containing protein [Candidatus Lokiarchaeota archaeon]|nr:leucine-rich repeat domain-containing protein [Candidatus Lokiarchaeota archaeon]
MSFNKITNLPESIGNLQMLKTLTLQNNLLKTIPDTITNLKNLNSLNIGNNKIKCLPENIGNLQNLQAIVLSNNPISEVPKSFANLSNLERIYIEKTKINELPTRVLNQKILLQRKYKFKKCKSPLFGITKYCSKCGQASGIEDRIVDLYSETFADRLFSTEKQLYLSLNQKQRDGFTILQYMNKSDEEYNLTTAWFTDKVEFEKSVFNINILFQEGKIVGLEFNDIWDINIKFLNAALWHFGHIKYLLLENMGVDSIPEHIGTLKHLEKLTLQYLRNTKFPDSLQNLARLKHFTVHSRGLDSVPQWISELVELENLDLGDTVFITIPKSILSLKKLKMFRLRSEQGFTIPPEIQKLTDLRELTIDATIENEVPETMKNLSNLEKLNLKGLREDFPDWIGELPNIKEVTSRKGTQYF